MAIRGDEEGKGRTTDAGENCGPFVEYLVESLGHDDRSTEKRWTQTRSVERVVRRQLVR
jgi:hypothetical protein